MTYSFAGGGLSLSAALLSFLLLLSPDDLVAQTLNLHLGADVDVVARGERVTYTATVTNTGSADVTSLVVELARPGVTSSAGRMGQNVGTFGNTSRWTVGTLAAGDSQYLVLFVTIDNNAPEGVLTATLSASAPSIPDVETDVDVMVVSTPTLRVNLVPDPGPAAPGEPFSYTASFGNVGTSAVPNVLLRMPVPAGADFAGASDGGTESDGLVVWNLGTVPSGSGGSVRLTVMPEAALGDGRLLTAEAEIFPSADPAAVVRSRAATPVHQNARLRIRYTVSQSDGFDGGDPTTFIATITNPTGTAQTNVVVHHQTPQFVSNTSVLGAGVSTFGNRRQWNVGTLGPGESRQVGFVLSASDARDGDLLRSTVLAHSDDSHALAAQVVLVDRSPHLRISVVPDAGPAVPGDPFVYTLTFGNVGAGNVSDVVLRLPVPPGAGFVAASDGGVISDGEIVWNLGTIHAGQGGSVYLTVLPEAGPSDGRLLVAVATLDPGAATGAVIRSSSATPVLQETPLRLHYAASQTVNGQSGGRATLFVTVSNTSSVAQNNVEVRVLRPAYTTFGFLGTGTATFGQTHTWTVGTLNPGESRQLGILAATTGAPQGELLRTSILAGSDAAHALAELAVLTDNEPQLRVSVTPDAGPVLPGEPFAYTLSFGNVGSADAANVILQTSVPEGTEFTYASDGGTESDDAVTWNVGTIAAGGGGSVRVTVLPQAGLADGRMLVARAALDSGASTGGAIRSTTATPVVRDAPLRVRYAVSQANSGDPGPSTLLVATVSNAGDVALGNVVVRIERPPHTNLGFLGTGTSTTGSSSSWTVGTLGPGESRDLVLLADLSGAPQGELIRGNVLAQSDGGDAVVSRTVLIDHAPSLLVSVAPRSAPAAPGSPATYALTFVNAESGASPDLDLRMRLPQGTSFTDATCGAVVADGYVSWDVGSLGGASGGQFFVTVTPNSDLKPGYLLGALAELDAGHGPGTAVRSSANTPVRASEPLHLSFAPDRAFVAPGSSVTYEMTAANIGGTGLHDVVVRFHSPPLASTFSTQGGNVSSFSNARVWNVGAIGAGQEETLTVTLGTAAGTTPGRIIRGPVLGTGTGTQQASAATQTDVIFGTRMNFPPQPADVLSPEEGTAFLIGAEEGEGAVSLDSFLEVLWSAPCDPEDDPLTYTWQLSDAPDFENLLIHEPSANGGTDTRFEIAFGSLVETLAASGVVVGEPVTLYHRVVATDGVHETDGEALSLTVTLETSVALERASDLPVAFALHGNYPNPFNPVTTFAFDLPETAHTELAIFDVTGRRRATVVSELLGAGRYTYTWNAAGLPSGVYLYRIVSGSHTGTSKLLLLK